MMDDRFGRPSREAGPIDAKYLFPVAVIVLLGSCGMAAAEVVPDETATVRFHGALQLQAGEAHRAPARLTIGAKVSLTPDPETSPLPSEITLALSPRIEVDTKGLPLCDLARLHDSSAVEAMRVCGPARVGHGALTQRIISREQGIIGLLEQLIAFNGRYEGKRAIFVRAESLGKVQARTVFVLVIDETGGPEAGVELAGALPRHPGNAEGPPRWGISAFNLTLGRSFEFKRTQRSYLTASCPINAEADADFTMAHATLGFGEEREVLTGAVRGECAN